MKMDSPDPTTIKTVVSESCEDDTYYYPKCVEWIQMKTIDGVCTELTSLSL